MSKYIKSRLEEYARKCGEEYNHDDAISKVFSDKLRWVGIEALHSKDIEHDMCLVKKLIQKTPSGIYYMNMDYVDRGSLRVTRSSIAIALLLLNQLPSLHPVHYHNVSLLYDGRLKYRKTNTRQLIREGPMGHFFVNLIDHFIKNPGKEFPSKFNENIEIAKSVFELGRKATWLKSVLTGKVVHIPMSPTASDFLISGRARSSLFKPVSV